MILFVVLLMIDAAVLLGLISAIYDTDISWGAAILIALGTSIGTMLAVGALGTVMSPILALLLCMVLVAGLLGVLISAMLGAAVKESFIISGLFMFIWLCIRIGLMILF
jgi:hypothetical protein